MHLYLFYLGGNAGQSNIEVHDLQFVATNTPEEAWSVLRQAWFGDPGKVHIDAYARVTWVDGYALKLTETPSSDEQQLFFVNVGAYHPSALAELHAFELCVAKTAEEAQAKVLSTALKGALQQHKDTVKKVNDRLRSTHGTWYIHLNPLTRGRRFQPEWQGYQRI